MIFRSMNASAVPRASQQSVSERDSRSPSLTHIRLSTNWEERSIAQFFDNYVIVSPAAFPGHLEFLPNLYSTSQDGDVLHESLLAVSMASLANMSTMRSLLHRSRVAYGRTLQLIITGISQADQDGNDRLLAAILLLQYYEVGKLMYSTTRLTLLTLQQVISGTKSLAYNPHEDGLQTLLRMRGSAQIDTPLGRGLLRTIHSNIQISRLDGKAPPPSNTDRVMKALSPLPMRMLLWQLLHEVSASCHRLRAILAGADEGKEYPTRELFQAFEAAQSLHSRLLSWSSLIPPDWGYRVCTLPFSAPSGLESVQLYQRVYLFDSIMHAGMWVGYWCSRIHLSQHLISILALLSQTLDVTVFSLSQDALRSELSTIVDDVCASAAYLLGHVDGQGELMVGKQGKQLGAYFLLRGLYVSSTVDAISDSQRQQILDYLFHIGHARGIQLALRRWREASSLSRPEP